MSWQTKIFPFVEQDNLWRQTDLSESGPAFTGDTNSYLPYRFYPWDNTRYAGLATPQPTFQCPADSRTLQVQTVSGFSVALTSYLGVSGISHRGGGGGQPNNERDPSTNLLTGSNGILITRQNTSGTMPPGIKIADIVDGTSNTFMVGERPPSDDMTHGWVFADLGNSNDADAGSLLGISERNEAAFGTDPAGNPCSVGSPDPNSPLAYKFGPGITENQCDMFHYWSMHTGHGGNWLFADGSVRFMTYELIPSVQRALATKKGREVFILP